MTRAVRGRAAGRAGPRARRGAERHGRGGRARRPGRGALPRPARGRVERLGNAVDRRTGPPEPPPRALVGHLDTVPPWEGHAPRREADRVSAGGRHEGRRRRHPGGARARGEAGTPAVAVLYDREEGRTTRTACTGCSSARPFSAVRPWPSWPSRPGSIVHAGSVGSLIGRLTGNAAGPGTAPSVERENAIAAAVPFLQRAARSPSAGRGGRPDVLRDALGAPGSPAAWRRTSFPTRSSSPSTPASLPARTAGEARAEIEALAQGVDTWRWDAPSHRPHPGSRTRTCSGSWRTPGSPSSPSRPGRTWPRWPRPASRRSNWGRGSPLRRISARSGWRAPPSPAWPHSSPPRWTLSAPLTCGSGGCGKLSGTCPKSSWSTTSPPCARRSSAPCSSRATPCAWPPTAPRRWPRGTSAADAIVLDVLMPHVDGLEVSRRLRLAGTARRCSCSRRATRSPTAWPGSTPEQTTTWSSCSLWTNSLPACGPCCAAPPPRARRPRCASPISPSTCSPTRAGAGRAPSSSDAPFALLELFLRHPRQLLTARPDLRPGVG